ncbi:DNA-processing protein DprA [Cellulomonas sp. PhB143]|uniref:DNA-processing protein DprA n=1 Tax=Cellulomonas sp. PhB143 TaxID=2485186 RepID=UPI000F914C0E|nr:DNA-processing protein DprA [Cellulomonas sp. PhB143]ROS77123.1 DNA protecting protein DprA [Cellulomonas sp. PhB143]
MAEPRFDLGDERLARAAWSRLVEPGDAVATALVDAMGPGGALGWVCAAVEDPAGAVRAADGGAGTDAAADAEAGAPAAPAFTAPQRLRRALERWEPRLDGLDPERDLAVLDRLGGRLVTPGAPGWPARTQDLGPQSPLCLWVRGDADLSAAFARSVALVGARACTDYGRRVATDLGETLASRGVTVLSGGAYGIDVAAHRGALAARGPTVAFLAGGPDRLYPAGNADVLRAVVERGGSVVSEVPPGSAPSRARFLLRNRLIAAAACATVVVEAAWRSGSLSTAARARDLLRPVGAVPGPVTSMASAGCHRLLREGAVCVTDADEVVELAGDLADLAPERAATARPGDELDPAGRRVFESLPLRGGAEPASVARAAGLSFAETLGVLGVLELGGYAERVDGRWRRAPAGRAGVGARGAPA